MQINCKSHRCYTAIYFICWKCPNFIRVVNNKVRHIKVQNLHSKEIVFLWYLRNHCNTKGSFPISIYPSSHMGKAIQMHCLRKYSHILSSLFVRNHKWCGFAIDLCGFSIWDSISVSNLMNDVDMPDNSGSIVECASFHGEHLHVCILI